MQLAILNRIWVMILQWLQMCFIQSKHRVWIVWFVMLVLLFWVFCFFYLFVMNGVQDSQNYTKVCIIILLININQFNWNPSKRTTTLSHTIIFWSYHLPLSSTQRWRINLTLDWERAKEQAASEHCVSWMLCGTFFKEMPYYILCTSMS